MEEYLQIGVITTTHGVRGEVKVYPTTDPERFFLWTAFFSIQEKKKNELHCNWRAFFSNSLPL